MAGEMEESARNLVSVCRSVYLVFSLKARSFRVVRRDRGAGL